MTTRWRRPLGRVIQEHIKKPLAEELLFGKLTKGGVVRVAVKDDAIDPAVGVILEVKVGQKLEAGAVLCRLYYTKEDRLEEAAARVEDAFRISATAPEPRELILEVVS